MATPTNTASIADSPQPEILARNGSYMAYRRLEEHVGKFREFLRQHGDTAEEQELIAAKLMGRWRSGAPLVLAPDKDDPDAWGRPAAKQRLQLQGNGPARLCGPARLAHSRRMNPRDTAAQHEPAPDDPPRGAVRASAAGRRARRRGRARDRRVRYLREPHPSVRVRAERLDKRSELPASSATNATRSSARTTARWNTRFPSAPFARKSVGLPAFTTLRGGAYFFLPGLKALGYLASLNAQGRA